MRLVEIIAVGAASGREPVVAALFAGKTAPVVRRSCNIKWEDESMFVVLLKFTGQKNKGARFMDSHNEWIKRGFDDGIFVLLGSLQPNLGGAIMAHNTTLSDLQSRVSADPFVAENVVSAEILEITPSKTDERLRFMLG